MELLTSIAVEYSVRPHYSAINVTSNLQNSATIYNCNTHCRILEKSLQKYPGVISLLRNKFDKLANAKKNTRDPSCSPSVRRANQNPRAIQGKSIACTLDDSSEEKFGVTTRKHQPAQ